MGGCGGLGLRESATIARKLTRRLPGGELAPPSLLQIQRFPPRSKTEWLRRERSRGPGELEEKKTKQKTSNHVVIPARFGGGGGR